MVGGGGSGSSAGGGGGYTKTFKSDNKGWKDGEAIAVKPGQSISITVGKGGAKVYQAEQNSPGKDGGYSQFMSSSYRANGGRALINIREEMVVVPEVRHIHKMVLRMVETLMEKSME